MSTEVTKEKLISDVRVVIHDAEELLRATAGQAGDKVNEARAKIEKSLKEARAKLGELQEVAIAKGKAAAKATDTYVRDNPWQSVGIAAGVGIGVGIIIGLAINRR